MGSVASGYLNAVDFSKIGTNDWINLEEANKSWSSVESISGAVSGGLRGGMDGLNTRDGNGSQLNGGVFGVSDMKDLSGVVGGLASSGVHFAMTGNATFNVLKVNGVGLLELRVGKDGISSQIGMGGADISAQRFGGAIRGVKEAKKVDSWKKDSERGSTLNAINMASYTKKDNATEVAKKIWSGELGVAYEQMQGNALGRTDGNTIYLSEKLLGGGKEGSGQIASMLDHEYTHIKGGNEMDARASGYDTYNILTDMFGLTGAGYENKTDIVYMSGVLKEQGMKGVFNELFFSNALDKTIDGQEYYFTTILDSQSRQYDTQNSKEILGYGWTEEKVKEVNTQRLEEAWEKQKAGEYAAYKDKEGVNAKSESEYGYQYATKKAFGESIAGLEKEKAFGYDAVTFDTVYNAGCTIASVAYMAYSTSGTAVSVKDANQILKDKNLFVNDNRNADQQNVIGTGSGFANAVNALVGEKYLEYIHSVTATNDLQRKLVEYATSKTNEYMAHMRVASTVTEKRDVHSVVYTGLGRSSVTVDSLLFGASTNKPVTFYNPVVKVLDPIHGNIIKDFSQIDRTDFFLVNRNKVRNN